MPKLCYNLTIEDLAFEVLILKKNKIIYKKLYISVMPSVNPLPTSATSASPTWAVKVSSPLSKPQKMKSKKLHISLYKIKNFDADDLKEKLEKLKSTGIRTKDHTLDLSRMMLQNPDLNTKLTLCELLRKAGEFNLKIKTIFKEGLSNL